MHPDLERLIRLQQLETAAEEARRAIADHPRRQQEVEDRLSGARDKLNGVKAALADALTKRRAEEKDVSTVQARLAKYKDQLLEVKTNREYQAMLHEIEAAQNEIKAREDRILESMMESDELAANLKQAEAEMTQTEAEAEAERTALEQELAGRQAEIDRTTEARTALTAGMDRRRLATFEQVARSRKGLAVAEARDGLCTVCHVRLRPQVFNEIRRNESIIQCESCQRILFFAGAPAPVPHA